MFKLISSPLKLLFTGLYWLIRGDSDVKIEMTNNRLYLKLETVEVGTDYVLHVDEISYRVKYKRFYLPDKVKMLYRVTLTRLKSGASVETWTDFYPDLIGVRFLDRKLVLNHIASVHLDRYFDP